MRWSILLVEDDFALGSQLVAQLEATGYVVRWLRRGDQALDASLQGVRLVVLDLALPGADGWEVLKAMRANGDVPILVLSARQGPEVRVRALELGADDYVTKPFWPGELRARVEARLRRPALSDGETVAVGTLVIDLERHAVRVDDAPCALSPAEHAFLAALARRVGKPVTRRELARASLDPDRGATDRALDVHASRLRAKLGTAGALVETVRGVGYRLRDDPTGDVG